jgi:hypothetical protein
VRLLREPLLQFLLLGALIFASYEWLSGSVAAPDEIYVSAGRQQNLRAAFEQTWRRAPDEREMAGIIDDFVRQEIAYREALKLGLDKEDTVLRRRMQQKFELLTDDLFEPEVVDPEVLESWYAENASRYRLPAVLTFRQIYFNTEIDAAAAADEAMQLLGQLRVAGAAELAAEAGDPTLLPPVSTNIMATDVARRFGPEFAAAIASLPVGEWSGPVESAFGIHLVKVETRLDGRVPEFGEVSEVVRRDWAVEQRAEQTAAFYNELLEQYDVVIAPLAQQEGALP